MNPDFLKRWEEIQLLPMVVQDREELHALYCLMRGIDCKSYFEIGASYGGSLHVLREFAVNGLGVIDLFEEHSAKLLRQECLSIAKLHQYEERNLMAHIIQGNSHDARVRKTMHDKQKSFDVVMIDAGHHYDDVRRDWKDYGSFATKMVVFHDITMPGVKRLWTEIGGGLEIISKGSTMGYGVKFVG